MIGRLMYDLIARLRPTYTVPPVESGRAFSEAERAEALQTEREIAADLARAQTAAYRAVREVGGQRETTDRR